MTQPRPNAAELLDAVREFLEGDLLPTLDGRLRFHTRVAVNVLETVGRELRHGPAAEDEERARLEGLADLLRGRLTADAARFGDGTTPDDPVVDRTDVEALARALAAGIRDGTVDVDDPRLRDHLRRTTRADLAIANPKWLDEAPSG